MVKNNDKEKWVYSGHGLAFDGASWWNFGNDFANNVAIRGVHNSSSSHADNHKNNILVWGEGATYGINGGFGSPEKKFSKVRAKFCFSLHYDYSNSYVFVNEQKVFMFKANNKILTSQLNSV